VETHRFHPDSRAAHRENLFTAAVTAVLVPPLLYFAEGERSPMVLGAFGSLGAVGVLAFYTWRARRQGLQGREITPEQVTVRDRAGEMKGPMRTLLAVGADRLHVTARSG
jgi:hypothetical protein